MLKISKIDGYNYDRFRDHETHFPEGKEFSLRIRITDPIMAMWLFQLLYSPETLEGRENLGFNLVSIGPSNKDELKNMLLEVIRYIDTNI